MSNIDLHSDLKKLEDALSALERSITRSPIDDRGHIDIAIHRFEFTIELFWKFLRHFLESRGELIEYRKDILKAAYKGDLIETEAIWLAMVNDRNLTSHTYNEGLADVIYERIKTYVPVLKKTLQTIQRKID